MKRKAYYKKPRTPSKAEKQKAHDFMLSAKKISDELEQKKSGVAMEPKAECLTGLAVFEACSAMERISMLSQSNIANYYDENMNLKPLSQLTKRQRFCIKKVKYKKIKGKRVAVSVVLFDSMQATKKILSSLK